MRTIRSARAAGFRISIVHLFLSSADMCVARVAERVQKGGHHVPEVDVRRRFDRCAKNFWHLYRPLCDRWTLMYNATKAADVVATGSDSTHTVLDPQLFGSFKQIANS